MKRWKLSLTILMILNLASIGFSADVTLEVIKQFDQAAGLDHQVKFADFDGDGDKDMLARYQADGATMSVGIWENIDGAYSDSANSSIRLSDTQVLSVVQKFNTVAGLDHQVKFGDMDGDGDKDMLAVFTNDAASRVIGLWENLGGSFSEEPICEVDLSFTADAWFDVGDFNNDGMDDISAMSQYSTYHAPKVVYGMATWPATITAADLETEYPVDSDYTQLGNYTCVVSGDFNADGYDDFYYPDQGTRSSTGDYGGRATLHFGGAAMTSTPDSVLQFGGTGEYILTNEAGTEGVWLRWFALMSDKGDFNGDGYDDIFTSAYYSYTSIFDTSNYSGNNEQMLNCGASVIFLGGPDFDNIPDAIMVAPNEFLQYTTIDPSITGAYEWMYGGYRTFNAGDVNNDGTDDLSMAAWYWDLDLIWGGTDTLVQAASTADAVIYREPLSHWTKGRFNTASFADQNGANVFGIGDINGDGIDDMGTNLNHYGAGPDPEVAQVFLGDAGLSGLMTPAMTLNGYKRLQSSMIDLDGDGISEMVGQDENLLLTIFELNTVRPSDMSWFNCADVNNDGKDDAIIMSTYGSTHPPIVVYGRDIAEGVITAGDLYCELPEADYLQMGNYTSIATGDFNADGVADFMFPDQGHATATAAYGGRSIIYYGGTDIDGSPDLVLLNDGSHPVPIGDGAFIWLRWHSLMPSSGDFNGDGYTDVFTAAYYSYTSILQTSAASGNEEQMLNTGCGLIYLGGPAMDDIPDAIIIPPDELIKYTTIDPTISGAYEWMYAGYRVYNAGDIDGDGTDELSLPAQFWDVSMIYSGLSSLVQANSLDETTIIREPAHWWSKDRYNSGYYLDQHGANMVPIGDVDGDGLADLGNTRNYFGNGPDDPGIRLFFGSMLRPGRLVVDYESPDFIQVESSNEDFDGDGHDDMVAINADGLLSLVKVTVNSATAANTVPAAAVHLAPVNGAELTGFVVDFAWDRSVDADDDAITYVFNSTIGELDTSINLGTDTSLTFDGSVLFAYDTPYSWSITSSDWWDNIASTPTTFSIAAPNDPPGAFSLISPAAGDTIRTAAIVLSWNPSTDPDEDIVTYDITIGNGTEDVTYEDISDTSYTVVEATFADFQLLTWSVVASDGLVETNSDTVTFYFEGTTGIIAGLALPTEFKVNQNYPNPFNPSTQIVYGIPEATEVQMVLYDVLGRQVATLVESYQNQGWYSVNWNGRNDQGVNLSAGIYLCRISAGDQYQIIKMVYAK